MSDALVLALIRSALETLMWLTGPLLVAAIVVGVVVSLVQTITAIQDQTFSFAPRIVTILVVFILLFPWLLRVIVSFTAQLFQDFSPYIQ